MVVSVLSTFRLFHERWAGPTLSSERTGPGKIKKASLNVRNPLKPPTPLTRGPSVSSFKAAKLTKTQWPFFKNPFVNSLFFILLAK